MSAGKPWPPPSEKERLQRYQQNKLLFEVYELVYKDWVGLREDQGNARNHSELAEGYHTVADLLLGETPRITAGDRSPEQTALIH